MPPIITVHFPASIALTCGESCYDNPSPRTHCVCSGRNNGIGLDAALKSNQQYQKAIAEELFQRFVYATQIDIITAETTRRKNSISYFSPRGFSPRVEHPKPDI